MSESKIRRVVQSFSPMQQQDAAMATTVYSVGWVPHVVLIQSTGCTEFLGGIYDMDNSSKSTLEWLKTKAKIAVQCVRSRKSFSAASKIAVITISTLNSLVYKATNATLSHEALKEVDTIIDNVLVSTTKNMFSYPRKLLHLDRSRGGLGLPSFSYLAESRKLQKLFSCMRSNQQHGLAARGLLSRAARKYGYFSSSGQRLVIIPQSFPTTTQHLYCDGPISMLADYGLYLCRHGSTTTTDIPSHPLVQLISTEDDDSLHTSLMNGLYTIGDCVELKNGK